MDLKRDPAADVVFSGHTHSIGKKKRVIVKRNDTTGGPESVLESRLVDKVIDKRLPHFGSGPVLRGRPSVRSSSGNGRLIVGTHFL